MKLHILPQFNYITVHTYIHSLYNYEAISLANKSSVL